MEDLEADKSFARDLEFTSRQLENSNRHVPDCSQLVFPDQLISCYSPRSFRIIDGLA